jgi:tetratricopeptide (TPR) repeat protein
MRPAAIALTTLAALMPLAAIAGNGSLTFGGKRTVFCNTVVCQCGGAAVSGYADDAVKICSAILDDPKISPSLKAGAFVDRAIARNFQGRYQDAVDDATQGLAIDFRANDAQGLVGAYFRRGQSYFQMKDDADANDDFTAAIAADKDDMPLYADRGNALLLEGRSDLALKDFQTAIDGAGRRSYEINSVSVTVTYTGGDGYFGRGAVYFLAGRYDQAAKDFAHAAFLEPGAAQAAFWLHYARLRLGQDDSAELAENTDKLAPGSREEQLAQMLLGRRDPAGISLAALAPDGQIVVDGACEAKLAIAEWTRFTKHDAAAARVLYQAVVSDCPRSLEVVVAQSMLASLPR